MAKDDASLVYKLFSTLLSVALFAGLAYGTYIVITLAKQTMDNVKSQLGAKGVKVSKHGVAVKTDKRALTREEIADATQRGAMDAWKAASFNVPDALKGTRIDGGKHDKAAKKNK